MTIQQTVNKKPNKSSFYLPFVETADIVKLNDFYSFLSPQKKENARKVLLMIYFSASLIFYFMIRDIFTGEFILIQNK